jgi:transcriptional regulator with XRE-family HTH domain
MQMTPAASLTDTECRMARAGLQWSVSELAARSRISRATIVRLENKLAVPIPSTLRVLRLTFEEHGVQFLGDNGVRVKMPPK